MNANIKVYLLKNATDTAAEAPYTWRVIPNGVANLNDLVADMLGRINSSDERVKMVVKEALECAIRRVRGGETVDIGPIRLKPRIPGSMPYEDSPFDPARDEFIVDVYVDAELADTFDGVVPSKVSADDFAGAIKVSNVMDVATEAFGEIRGSADFEVLGNGLTLDGEGESVKLLDRKTDAVLAAAEVDSVSKGQRATCKFAAVPGGIAKGAYVVEVTTFGLIGETTPRVFRKPVTLVEAIPAPAPKKRIAITWTEGGANAELGKTYINIEGENFDGVRDYETGGESDCTFSGKVTPEGGSPVDVTFSGAVGGSLMIATLDTLLEVGTKYTVELEPDPAKTDFDPAHAVAEGEVAEA